MDSITHSPAALRVLVEEAGVENVLLGSDQPFDMGTVHAVAEVEDAITDPYARAAILGGNARRLLRLVSQPGGSSVVFLEKKPAMAFEILRPVSSPRWPSSSARLTSTLRTSRWRRPPICAPAR